VECSAPFHHSQENICNLHCIRAFQRIFHIQDQPIETVTKFKYLGRILTSRDNDWEAARCNLKKAKQRWATISRVLIREAASPKISALFYKATIQTVLLYGSETWAVNNKILQLLTSFHHGVARRLTGRYPRPIPETDEWIYPSIKHTLHLAGIFTMNEFLRQRRGYLESYGQQLQLLSECQQSSQRRATQHIFWWNQPLSSDALQRPPGDTNNIK
jgi:hypothetical protein